jgi:hypothetical protein
LVYMSIRLFRCLTPKIRKNLTALAAIQGR